MKNTNDPDKPASTGGEDTATPTPAEYLKMARTALAHGNQKEAFAILQQATVMHAHDPLILSYFGYVQVVVDKKFRTGVETCRRAITMHKKNSGTEGSKLFPLLYLNLGRAFVNAGKKKEAIDAFEAGLKYNSRQVELIKELRQFGTRAKPLITFLDRANPLNIVIGKVLRGKKEPSVKGKGTRSR